MRRKYLLFIFFALTTLACGLLVHDDTDSQRPLSTVFDNPVCEPPCWMNIVPGKTTEEQVRQILKTLVDENKIFEQVYPDKGIYLFFNKIYPNGEKGETFTITIWDNIVKRIEFQGIYRHLSLSYALKISGEPDYAIQEMYGEIGWMTILYYPAIGIEIWCMPNSSLFASIGCNIDNDVRVHFYSPKDYEARLLERYGSPEKAKYAQSFFCPWVGVEADYLSVDWGSFNNPNENPTASSTKLVSRCPSSK